MVVAAVGSSAVSGTPVVASLSANERPLTKWDELAIKVAKFDVRPLARL